jgi:chromate reductase
MPKQIGYVIGSLRKDSYNRKLANALVRLGPTDFNFKELRIGDLPLYNQDDDRSQAPEVQRLKSELRAVDAVIFVTAEYNRSVTGIAPGPENRLASSAPRSVPSVPRWRSRTCA